MAGESDACRPFVKPLVLLTPKYLLHHRPATSALADFTVGTFFNRVIDDGKASTPEPLSSTSLQLNKLSRLMPCLSQWYLLQ